MKVNATATLNKKAFPISQFTLRNMRINVLRRMLLLAAAISAGLFAGFFGVSLLLPKQDLEKQLIVGNDLVITNPRFIGHSSSGGKITIVAEKALRSINGNDAVVSLVNPHVTSGSGADLVAVNGIWNQATQELELSKNVVYKNSNGDNATSDFAYWMANDPRIHDLKAPVPKNAAKQEAGQPLTWLIGNVQLFRKSGEKLNSDLAIWNDKTGVLDAQGNVALTSGKNHITAKNIKFDRPSAHAYAKGGVTVTTEKVTAQSETLDFDNNTKTVYGFDNVIITSGGNSARAKSYEYNLDTKRVVLKGGVSGLMVKEK
jgi:hypothetical protein